MPRLDGISATAALRRRPDPPDVIVLTTFDADENVLRALRAGASGFLLKDTPPARIVEAVRRVAAGEQILSPTVLRRFLARFAADDGSADRARSDFAKLTEREADVVLAVARGRTNAGDRRRALPVGGDREDPHLARDDQARPGQPDPAGAARPRRRPGLSAPAAPLSRRRAGAGRPRRPRPSAAATASSTTSGTACGVCTGALPECWNGEASSTQPGRLSNWPIWPSSRHTASTAQAAATSRGTAPTSAAASAPSTQTAGTCAIVAPISRPIWPASPVRSACTRPSAAPAASSSQADPSAATSTYPPPQRSRSTAPASTGSARCSVSSVRARSTACTAYAAATRPSSPTISDR